MWKNTLRILTRFAGPYAARWQNIIAFVRNGSFAETAQPI